MLDEVEYDSQFVAGTACPGASEFTLELVSFERRKESVLFEPFQRILDIGRDLSILLHGTPGSPDEVADWRSFRFISRSLA
jgi:hypothetical protein